MAIYNLLIYELYLFIFLVPLLPYRTKYLIFPISADTVIGAVFIVTFAVYLFTGSRFKRFKDIFRHRVIYEPLFKGLIAYSAILFISLIHAKSRSVGIGEILRFLEYPFFFYFIVYCIKDKHIIENMFRVFTCSFVIALLCGIMQSVFLTTRPGQDLVRKIFYSEEQFYRNRIYSTFVNPNYWGAFLNLVLFVYIFSFKQKKGFERNLYGLIILLGLGNLFLTFTVGSWISFVLVAVVLLFMRNKKIILPAALTGFSVLVVLALIPYTRHAAFYLIEKKVFTGNERVILWYTGLLMFKDHPIIGVGSGNYLVRYIEYVKAYPFLNLGRKEYSVHNSYIKVMAETGVLGIGAFLFTLYNLVKKSILHYRSSEGSIKDIELGALAGIFTYLIQNLTNNMFFIPQVNIFFWIIVASEFTYERTFNGYDGGNRGLV